MREENLTIEWNNPEFPDTDGRCRVTADGWKLNLYRGDQPELYDLRSDPGELTNRAADPAQRDRVRRSRTS
jgi:arylsulfatase A-like enzyme